MAIAPCFYFALFYLLVVLLHSGQPTVIRTFDLGTDSTITWTTRDITDINSGRIISPSPVDDIRTSNSDSSSAPEISSDRSLDVHLGNWSLAADSCCSPTDFHLAVVDVSDMNSSGEETTGNVQQEFKIQDSEEMKALENLHIGIVKTNLFSHHNATELDNVVASESTVDFHTGDATKLKETSVFNALLNDYSSDENLDIGNNETANGTLVNEIYSQVHLNNSENSTFMVNASGVSSGGSHSSHPDDLQHTESGTGDLVSVLNVTGNMHTGLTDTVIDSAYLATLGHNFDEPNLATTVTSQVTSDSKGDVTHMSTQVNSNLNVSLDVITTNSPLAVSNAVPQQAPCPSPGICVLWFLARHSCESSSDCSDSRVCCRINCSRTCISL